MNNRIKLLVVALMALMANFHAASGSVLIDGIRYELDDEAKTAELSCKSTGSAIGQDYTYYYSEKYSGDVVIPASVEYEGKTYSVTSIGDGAFVNCPHGLESLTIPTSITHISGIAFGLVMREFTIKKLYLPSLEWWLSVDMGSHKWSGNSGYGPFMDNTVSFNPLAQSDHVFFGGEEWDMTTLVIPEGTTDIKHNQFFRCTRLTNVTLPSTLKTIGDMAFCFTGITSLPIPSGVESIGSRAFYKCENLVDIHFGQPSSLKAIGKESFYQCGLTSVVIPESVELIDEKAFMNCDKLEKFDMGDGVVAMKGGAISNCRSLTYLAFGKNFSFSASKENNNTYFFSSLGSFDYVDGNYVNPSLNTIVSRIWPPLATDNFYFATPIFNEATLYVPVGTRNAYACTGSWQQFKHIVEDPSLPATIHQPSVNTVNTRSSGRYDLQGRRLNGRPSKGVYIENGRKVVVDL